MFLLCKAKEYRRSLRRTDILEVKVGNDQEIISHLINEKKLYYVRMFQLDTERLQGESSWP